MFSLVTYTVYKCIEKLTLKWYELLYMVIRFVRVEWGGAWGRMKV